ncbi:hypothetical protein MMC16_003981 [Acarospora aff. strigata]|nr:hypothetical protein [Acarospora aff. strigata]
MSYQYGYNSQPAFVQPQNQHVYGAQAFQGQQPPAHQQQFYPSPYARIQPQQRPPPQYAGQTGMATSMGGASNGAGGGRGMMPVARTPQHQPQNQQSYILNHQSPYSTAVYPQSTPTKPYIPAQQSYQQASPPISPPLHQSPTTSEPVPQRPMTTQMQSQGPTVSHPPTQSQSQQQQSQTQSHKANLETPTSPTFAAREKSRVSTLLEINRLLLQEVVDLQAQNKVSVPNQSPTQQTPIPIQPQGQAQGQESDTNKPKHSQEFIECMRRLQSNLAYLASIADRSHKPASAIPNAPAIMEAPPQYPSFEDSYAKLRELFPDAKTVAPQRPTPHQQRSGRPAAGGMMPPGTMAQGMQVAAAVAGGTQRVG